MERIPAIQEELAQTHAELRAEVRLHEKTQSLLYQEIAANKRRVRRNVVAYLIVFAGLIGVWNIAQNAERNAQDAIVSSGAAVAVDGCNRDFDTITNLRVFLERTKRIQQRSVANGVLTPEQAKRGEAFYDLLLNNYPLPDCRAADDVITADPDEVPKAPIPRYPGDTTSSKGD